MLRTHQGGVTRALTPAGDVAAIANEPYVYVAYEGIPQRRQSDRETTACN